jgi:5-amino-6-(5-phosphoribosylamino)uracil reductase
MFEPIKVLYNTRDDDVLRNGRKTIWGDLTPDPDGREDAEHDQLPYTYGLFIQSSDGKATDSLEGGVGRMAGVPSDRYGQLELRATVDAFLVGGGTLRADRTVGAPTEKELMERRKKDKGDVAPLNVFFSESGDIPADSPVFRMRDVKTVLVVTEKAETRFDGLKKLTPDVVMVSSVAPLKETWSELYRRGITTIGFEGGPKLMGLALRERIVHELLLTHSPQILGGSGTGYTDTWAPLEGVSARRVFLGLDQESGLLFERSRVIYK